MNPCAIFPKDIWRLLMLKYLAPQDALRCSQVCRTLHQLVPTRELQKRIVKEQARRKQLKSPGCFLAGILGRDAMNNFNFECCPECEVPEYDQVLTWHRQNGCPLETVQCCMRGETNSIFTSFCQFDPDWRIKRDKHKCAAQCKECGQIVVDAVTSGENAFKRRQDHITRHIDRSEISRRLLVNVGGILMMSICYVMFKIFFTNH